MLHVRTPFRIAAAVRYDVPIIEPIYTAVNAQPAYQLNWGLTLFCRQTPVPDTDRLPAMQEVTEADGVRAIKHQVADNEASQFFVSTTCKGRSVRRQRKWQTQCLRGFR